MGQKFSSCDVGCCIASHVGNWPKPRRDEVADELLFIFKATGRTVCSMENVFEEQKATFVASRHREAVGDSFHVYSLPGVAGRSSPPGHNLHEFPFHRLMSVDRA